MGSVPEGTRVGLANEVDIVVDFEAFKEHPFGVTEDDPFHLRINAALQDRCSDFLDKACFFNFEPFILTYLGSIEFALESVFTSGLNPPSISIVTTNGEYSASVCAKCSRIPPEKKAQCADCAIVVSRTKIGACLQFKWSHDGTTAYCSMDVVPKFSVEKMKTLQLALLINKGMTLLNNGVLWRNHLRSYVEADMVVQDLDDAGQFGTVDAVILKQLILDDECCGYVRNEFFSR